MKKFEMPTLEIEELAVADIIAASVETCDDDWDLPEI